VTSFELKGKLLEGVILELQKLQDERSLNDERQWDSSEEDVDAMIEVAKAFVRHIDSLDLADRK